MITCSRQQNGSFLKSLSLFTRFLATDTTTSSGPSSNSSSEAKPSKDDIIYKAADKIIEERIRPFIQQDGGDVTLEDVQNGMLVVSLTGACQGCRSKSSTLHNGILGIIQDEVPGVIGIREKMDFEDL